MQISNHFSISPVDALKNATKTPRGLEPEASSDAGGLTPVDQLDLSAEAQGVDESNGVSDDIRVDLVANIRRQIADGTYDTDEKLTAALDKFIDQLH